MTHQLDVARSREIIARWCMLAQQRLEYLTELFETGRWRRYHSELAFLENIQEARAAVENWRKLSLREASGDNDVVEISWPTRRTAALLSDERLRDQIFGLQAKPAEGVAEPAAADLLRSQSELGSVAPATNEASELALDLAAIAERYPLLRNKL